MSELNALTYGRPDVHLMLSIASNDVQTVTNLLSAYKIDPDIYFRMAMDEIPAVMLCIAKGNYEIAKVFIQQGCSVNRTDQNGLSCLHMAVKRQNAELVRLLLERRAAVNCSTFDNQNSPLHYACTLPALGE